MPARDGGRVVDRRDDLDEAVFLRDLDAETAELALGLGPHVLEALGVKVARMRIERRQHAVDRGLDELLLVGLLDIVGAHLVENVAEQAEMLVGVGAMRRALERQAAARACWPSVAHPAPMAIPVTIKAVLRIIRQPSACLTSPTMGPSLSKFRPCGTRRKEWAASRRSRWSPLFARRRHPCSPPAHPPGRIVRRSR